MTVKDLSKYSDAEKIVLAEELWDSVSKKIRSTVRGFKKRTRPSA